MSDERNERTVDPGDAVPEGVAPKYPPPLSEEELRVKRKLEQLGEERKGAGEQGAAGDGNG